MTEDKSHRMQTAFLFQNTANERETVNLFDTQFDNTHQLTPPPTLSDPSHPVDQTHILHRYPTRYEAKLTN